MKTEIITLNTINTNLPTFTDDRLNKATQRIMSIYTDAAKYAETKNREIAKILGEVAEKKSYEADGFKSVADYASSVFGIARQNAYALASAGKVYNDKDAHPELKAMTPSKIAELTSVDPAKLEQALELGEINRGTTQKSLREFANKVKEETSAENPIVLDQFTARLCCSVVDFKFQEDSMLPRTMPEWDDFFADFVSSADNRFAVEIIPLKTITTNDDNIKRKAQRRLYLSRGYSLVVEFYKYKETTKKISSKSLNAQYTIEELRAMLAEAEKNEAGSPKESENLVSDMYIITK